MSIVITVLVAILIFGVLILVHELGHFLAAKASGVTVLEFSIGMGPKLISWGKKTKYSLRLLPIGGFVSMEGEDQESNDPGSYGRAPVIKRMLIIVAGAFMNLLLGFIILIAMVSSDSLIATKTVAYFEENAMTHETGLEIGDTLYSINGRRLIVADDLFYEMARVDGGKADMVVIRDGSKVELSGVTFDTVKQEGGTESIVLDFKVLGEQKSFGGVIKEAALQTVSKARLVWVSLIDLITGRVAVSGISGPIGIGTAIGQSISYGITSVLNLSALITINLGIFNMLPLPALDGGKFVFLLYEAITKRKPNPKVEVAVTVIGFVLIFGLLIFATWNDIARLIG